MDDLLKNYFTQKYGEGYDKKAQEDLDSAQTQNKWANFASNLGDVIAGNKVGSANQYFQGLNQEAKANTVGKYEKEADKYVKDKATNAQLKDFITKEELDKAQSDPLSRQSVLANALAKKFNLPVQDGDSYKDISQFMDPKKMMETEAASNVEFNKQKALRQMDQGFKTKENKLDRKSREEDRKYSLNEKMQEKEIALKTPYGMANTVDDAKQLKAAHEEKVSFDNKLNALIELREKHKGGNIFNREDVARGKQLSKDLLLIYKNIAKLGVLSAADEKIINAIIPDDPLKFNSPLAAVQGQDPILHQLKEFKKDTNKDFINRVATRTRDNVKLSDNEGQDEKYQKAFQWAQNNPDDPRSEAIIKKISSKVAGK